MTASLRFAHSDSTGLPRYNCFAAGSSTYPCHMACISKSVTKDVISLSGYVPNSTEGMWMRCAIVRADHSASLSHDYQGQVHKLLVLLSLHKVVLFQYSLCLWLPCRNRDPGANIQTRWVACKTRYSWTKKREFLVKDTWEVVLVRSFSVVVISLFSCVEQIIGKKYWRRIL